MAKMYEPIGWQDGTIIKEATVTIDNIEYPVTPEQVEGSTPLTASNLKHMDDAIKELYDEGTTSKDIVIGSEEETTEDTKLLIETGTLATLGTEVVNSLSGNEVDKAPSVKAVNDAIGIVGWTNPNPTSEFASQTITLNTSDYDELVWVFDSYTNSGLNIICSSLKGFGVRATASNGTGSSILVRSITRNSDTSFTVGDGYNSNSVDKNSMIPRCVIAKKTNS